MQKEKVTRISADEIQQARGRTNWARLAAEEKREHAHPSGKKALNELPRGRLR